MDKSLSILRCGRSLLSCLGDRVPRSTLHQLYDSLCQLEQEDTRPRGEQGLYHELGALLEIATVAVEELSLDSDSVLAALTLPLVTTGRLTMQELEQHYGAGVARLSTLLNRTSRLYLRQESISSENFHNLLLSIAEDIRVILLIIAHRLYALRHAKRLPHPEDRLSLAVEVSFLYAPIAHRLGLYKVKGEMEDLCLKYRDRETFDLIKRKLGETKATRDSYIEHFIAPVRKALDAHLDVPYEMKGRTKSISSIHNKLKKQSFEDIYDLFAIRIIVDVAPERERQVCWQVYSIITDLYQPNPERLKDWISIPKSNGYESLHTTVMGPDNKWVEVQIRSRRMDAIAEQGVAAHWRYKGIKSENGLDEFLASVRETLESVREQPSGESERLLEASMMTLRADEIYVFTPKGEVIKLPRGATVLDFAFSIHSRIGASAISGKVNGKNVSIKHQLHNGDSVEIVTSPQQTPRADWLTIVVSTKARNRIRQILRAEEEAGIGVSKEMMHRRIKNRKLPSIESLFIKTTHRWGYKTLTDFYRDITSGKVDVNNFLDDYEREVRLSESGQHDASTQSSIRSASDFVAPKTDEEEQEHKHSSGDVLVLGPNLQGVAYSMAQCCSPVYGDEVFGLVSGRAGIKIHRVDCPNAGDIFARSGHRVLPARWSGMDSDREQVVVEIVGKDDIAVVTNITSLIKKDNRIKLRSYSIDSADGLFYGHFTLYVESRELLSQLIKKMRSAAGVKSVKR